MPYQGQLFIGQKVRSRMEAVKILRELDDDPNHDWDEMERKVKDENESNLYWIPVSIPYKGEEIKASVGLHEVWEDNYVYQDDEYTNALVGFSLTNRYKGSILDKDWTEYGRPEPFEFDVDDLKGIMDRVKGWWADARVLILTVFY